MSGRKIAGLFGALAGILFAGAAHATIIDFDQGGDPLASSYNSGDSFATNGGLFNFAVQSGGPAIVDMGGISANCFTGYCSDSGGTQALFVFGQGAVRLTSPGNVFTVSSFDAAAATADFLAASLGSDNFVNSQIRVIGGLHSGGTIEQLFPLLASDPNYNFLGQGLGGFTNLDYLDFAYDPAGLPSGPLDPPQSGDFAVDNILLDVTPLAVSIPEPASIALFAMGLAGFGWARRKLKRSIPKLCDKEA